MLKIHFYLAAIIFVINTLTSLASGINNQKNYASPPNSVLSSGNWYKFSIDSTGVYKLDRRFLESLGVNASQINPKKIQLYGNGGHMLPLKNSEFRYEDLQQNAIQVVGEEDEVFDKDDYVLFYGQGPHRWVISANNFKNINHEYNLYSEKSYYFITISTDDGKRIQEKTPVADNSTPQIIDSFHDFVFFEKDEVNINQTGRQWFGDSFDIQRTRNYRFSFSNISSNSEFMVRTRTYANSSNPVFYNISVNNNLRFDVFFNNTSGESGKTQTTNHSFLLAGGDRVDLAITLNNNGNPSADGYLDYIEVFGKKDLAATGKQFLFRNLDSPNQLSKYTISGAAQIQSIWNITDPLNPLFIENEDRTEQNYEFLEADSSKLQQYILLNENDYYLPSRLDQPIVENQNLHGLSDVNYLIITNEQLKSQAQRLADFHATNSGLSSKVVMLDKIYNEFSSGSPDISAIRDFIKHVYQQSSLNPLKYVCLFGDTTYDYKNRISGNNNRVPTYYSLESFDTRNSFASDDFFVMLDDNEGNLEINDQQDVAIGRILATDRLDAKNAVDKILGHYDQEAFGKWRTRVSLIADDSDSAQDETIQITVEELAQKIETLKPELNIKKIYLDAYKQEISAVGSKYPEVNEDIKSEMENGTLMVNYFGHGGFNGLAQESIVTSESINSWKSEVNQQLFVTITCNFTRFDDPSLKSAGEILFDKTNGGSLVLISTTRDIFVTVGQSISTLFTEELFGINASNYSIATHLMNAKNNTRARQRFMIFYFGDPAMKLAIPEPIIQLTKMNDVALNQAKDTIKSLSKVNFEGAVLATNGNIDSNFNGTLDVTIFDKAQNKQTLRNDGVGSVMNFKTIENKIFTGKTAVENGQFQFEFVAPKNLRVGEFGAGKISLYASNQTSDKIGYDSSILVGGINEQAPEDVTGPSIDLYMNDLLFVNGSNTNQSPLLIAVLQDENGINTSSASVGQDLTAIIDGDQSNIVVLNDFYETELNDFRNGKINYQLSELAPGKHSITIKAWDTYNNSSEATLNFTVINDDTLELTNVLNYPNPFTSYTEFWFNHNKPNELLEVQIQILSVSGKLVKTLNQTVQPTGNLSRSIQWNGRDDFGNRIARGTYIYKLIVKHLASKKTSKKIQKLVKI